MEHMWWCCLVPLVLGLLVVLVLLGLLGIRLVLVVQLGNRSRSCLVRRQSLRKHLVLGFLGLLGLHRFLGLRLVLGLQLVPRVLLRLWVRSVRLVPDIREVLLVLGTHCALVVREVREVRPLDG